MCASPVQTRFVTVAILVSMAQMHEGWLCERPELCIIPLRFNFCLEALAAAKTVHDSFTLPCLGAKPERARPACAQRQVLHQNTIRASCQSRSPKRNSSTRMTNSPPSTTLCPRVWLCRTANELKSGTLNTVQSLRACSLGSASSPDDSIYPLVSPSLQWNSELNLDFGLGASSHTRGSGRQRTKDPQIGGILNASILAASPTRASFVVVTHLGVHVQQMCSSCKRLELGGWPNVHSNAKAHPQDY